MERITRGNILKHTGDFNEDILPYMFTEKYEHLIKTGLKNDYLLFFSKKTNAIIPVRRFSVRSFTFIQPLYSPISLSGKKLSSESEKQFLNEFVDLVIAEKMAIRILQSYSYASFQSFPNASKYCPFGTYVLNLESHTKDELFSAIHPKHRNVIRNAERHGITIKYGKEALPDFYALYSQTMARGEMFCEPYDYFAQMHEVSGNDNIICGVAYNMGKPQSALLIPYTNYSSYYLYGASSVTIDITGTANFLHWKIILLLKQRGVKQYDFAGARLSNIEGTRLEGIQNFKKRFGGELKKGYLWKKDIDSIKCKLFDTLMQAKHIISNKEIYKDIIDEELEKNKMNNESA